MAIEVEAQGKTFTFPDGTSNEDIGNAIDDYFSEQSTPEQGFLNANVDFKDFKEPSVAETINILRDNNFQQNAERLGFKVIPQIDEITGEEISTSTLTMERDGEIYKLNPSDLRNQMIGAIRPGAQALGSLGGILATTPTTLGVGSVPGAVAGGVIGGQAVDVAASLFSDSGRDVGEVAGQLGKDIEQEAIFGLGGEVLGRAVRPVAQYINSLIKQSPEAVRPRIEPELKDLEAPASPADIRQMAADIPKQKIPELAQEVRPRQDIVSAAKEEGFDLTPDQYSGNPAFIELAQAAKSSPESTLAAKEIETINKLGKELDDLKLSVGGDIDKAAVNQKVATEFTAIVKKLKTKEEEIYKKLDAKIPLEHKEMPQSLADAVEREAAKVGGKQNLSGVWAVINDSLSKNVTEAKTPAVTYGYLNNLKETIASGYKNQGGFKDAATGELDQAYKAVSQDLQMFADKFNVGADMRLARKISAERIGVQKNAVKFGKDLVDKDGNITDGPFVHKLEAAVSNLARGNSKPFDDLIKALPESQRKAVAVSAIDPLLSSSRIQSGKITGTMANAGRSLSRNPTAKAKLYKHLSESEAKRLDNLFLIADGVFTSVERQNASRTARDILKSLDDQLAPLQKLYGVVRGVGRYMEPTTTAAVDTGNAAVKNIVSAKSTTAEAADKLLSSRKFQSALSDYMENDQFKANKIASEMPEYKQWLNTQPKAVREDIGRIGLFNWMFRAADQAKDIEFDNEEG